MKQVKKRPAGPGSFHDLPTNSAKTFEHAKNTCTFNKFEGGDKCEIESIARAYSHSHVDLGDQQSGDMAQNILCISGSPHSAQLSRITDLTEKGVSEIHESFTHKPLLSSQLSHRSLARIRSCRISRIIH